MNGAPWPGWPRFVAACPLSLAVAVGCTGDDIVVYRNHAAANDGPDSGSDAPVGEKGGAAGQGGGAVPSKAGSPSGGARGSGGRNQPSDAASPTPTGGNGGRAVVSTGGTFAGGGSGAGGGVASMGGAAGAGSGGTGNGGVFGVPVTCATSNDCATGWSCAKVDCAAPAGVCQPRPILCDPTPLPVCGCDGVTYWNDCIRQQNGVSQSALTQCIGNVKACNTAADCGVVGASCARVSPIPTMSCGPAGPGTCWVAPADCTSTPAAPLWMPCAPGSPGQGPMPHAACVDTCTAVRSGEPHVAAMPGCR